MRNTLLKVGGAFYLTLALLFASCVNKISDEIQKSNIPISFSIKTGKKVTKVVDNAFESGDKLGIFALLSGNSLAQQRYIDNLLLNCGGGSTLIPQKEVFYPEGDVTLDFISYYPYQAEGISKGASTLSVGVQGDQSKAVNYSLSNFMTARTEKVPNNTEVVQLEYRHQFAKIKLVLTPKEGENVDDMLAANPRIIATGFKTKAVYNLQTDELAAVDEDSETDIVPYGTWKKDGEVLSGKEFIIVPQTHPDTEQAFTLEWNGKIYTCSLPSAVIKKDTELEIRIDALQSTSSTLEGIIVGIKDWEVSETGESENNYNITAIHTASFSFKASDVYRIYHQGRPVAEVCREFLNTAADDEIHSKAIVAYPVGEDERADMKNGLVLQLPDRDALIHGGKVSWDEVTNMPTYTAGSSKPVEKFYIDENRKIVTEVPDSALAVNISIHTIRDMRDGNLQTYPIVKIGTQYWMKEDLQATCYNDGQSIPLRENLGEGEGYFTWKDVGYPLYNGEAVLSGKLSPLGWRVSTRDDWNRLKEYLGDNAAALKKVGSWTKDEIQPTDETGFSSQLRGLLLFQDDITKMLNQSSATAYWVYDGEQEALNEVVLLIYNNNNIDFKFNIKPADKEFYHAFSVRCVKE